MFQQLAGVVGIVLLAVAVCPSAIAAQNNRENGRIQYWWPNRVSRAVVWRHASTTPLIRPPGYNPGRPYPPLMIVYHGKDGSGAAIQRKTGSDAVAAANAFIVAHPEDQDGRFGPRPARTTISISAVVLIQSIPGKLPIEQDQHQRERLFGGRQSASTLFHARWRNSIAGFGQVAGSLSPGVANKCAPSRPISGITFPRHRRSRRTLRGGTEPVGKAGIRRLEPSRVLGRAQQLPGFQHIRQYFPDTLSTVVNHRQQRSSTLERLRGGNLGHVRHHR